MIGQQRMSLTHADAHDAACRTARQGQELKESSRMEGSERQDSISAQLIVLRCPAGVSDQGALSKDTLLTFPQITDDLQ